MQDAHYRCLYSIRESNFFNTFFIPYFIFHIIYLRRYTILGYIYLYSMPSSQIISKRKRLVVILLTFVMKSHVCLSKNSFTYIIHSFIIFLNTGTEYFKIVAFF